MDRSGLAWTVALAGARCMPSKTRVRCFPRAGLDDQAVAELEQGVDAYPHRLPATAGVCAIIPPLSSVCLAGDARSLGRSYVTEEECQRVRRDVGRLR